jgi:starvation-inducible outer membrane lipoprotein
MSGVGLSTLGRNRTSNRNESQIMKKNIALIFAASTLILAGCSTTPHQAKWEYKEIEKPSGTASEDQLNQLGEQGWRVVGATVSTREIPLYILEREKQ